MCETKTKTIKTKGSSWKQKIVQHGLQGWKIIHKYYDW